VGEKYARFWLKQDARLRRSRKITEIPPLKTGEVRTSPILLRSVGKEAVGSRDIHSLGGMGGAAEVESTGSFDSLAPFASETLWWKLKFP
jgi:hypothetical protein